jgi:hypothetical protein
LDLVAAKKRTNHISTMMKQINKKATIVAVGALSLLLLTAIVVVVVIVLVAREKKPDVSKEREVKGKDEEPTNVVPPPKTEITGNTDMEKAQTAVNNFEQTPSALTAVRAVQWARQAGDLTTAQAAVDFLQPLEPLHGSDYKRWLSAGVPRGVINTHCVCYAIAGFQALATFQPLFVQLLSGIGNDELDAKFVQLRVIMRDLTTGSCNTSTLDLVALRDKPGWNDAANFVNDIFNQPPTMPRMHKLLGSASLVYRSASAPDPSATLFTPCLLSAVFGADGHLSWARKSSGPGVQMTALGPLIIIKCTEKWSSDELMLNSHRFQMPTFLDPTQEATYELKAVVLVGTGHAYAYVQRYHRDKDMFCWYQCNDQVITPYPESEYPDDRIVEHRPEFKIALQPNQLPVLFFLRVQ